MAAVLLLATMVGAAWGVMCLESESLSQPSRVLGASAQAGEFDVKTKNPFYRAAVPSASYLDELTDRLGDDDDRWKALKTVRNIQDRIPLEITSPPSSSPREWLPVGFPGVAMPPRLRC